jgi:hypothetical protein
VGRAILHDDGPQVVEELAFEHRVGRDRRNISTTASSEASTAASCPDVVLGRKVT